jgi:hypothetical protein
MGLKTRLKNLPRLINKMNAVATDVITSAKNFICSKQTIIIPLLHQPFLPQSEPDVQTLEKW